MSEMSEQMAVIEWAELRSATCPELNMLYHVPNEGKRNPRTGALLKRQGLKPGVPDLCLPVPRYDYHGLYIEMKDHKKNKVTEYQDQWLKALKYYCYRCFVCGTSAAAIMVISDYLGIQSGFRLTADDMKYIKEY